MSRDPSDVECDPSDDDCRQPDPRRRPSTRRSPSRPGAAAASRRRSASPSPRPSDRREEGEECPGEWRTKVVRREDTDLHDLSMLLSVFETEVLIFNTGDSLMFLPLAVL